MKKEVSGQGSMFINRFANVFMAAPMYLMYLSAILLAMYLLGQFVPSLDFKPLDFGLVALLFLLFYAVGSYVSLGTNYNDIIVGEDQIQIVNRIPGFRRKVSVALKDVEEVLVAESHIDLHQPRVAGILRETYRHPERKWVEIRANGRTARWNCYGINDGMGTADSDISTLDELVTCLKRDRKLPVRILKPSAA